jgi:ATP-dependent Clp protease ATP-binding subunit ClpC
VILFDEIEKAHPDVLNLLLQILEDGTLTDAYGNHVDFKNSLVLMTSNLGSHLITRGGRMGFQEPDPDMSFERIRQEIMAELQRAFRPEFINRVDEVIVFRALGEGELLHIVDLLLEDINLTLFERGLEVVVDDEVKAWLLREAGVDPSVGARPLRRTIQRHVQDAVSELLISQVGPPPSRIHVRLADGRITLEAEGAPEEALLGNGLESREPA